MIKEMKYLIFGLSGTVQIRICSSRSKAEADSWHWQLTLPYHHRCAGRSVWRFSKLSHSTDFVVLVGFGIRGSKNSLELGAGLKGKGREEGECQGAVCRSRRNKMSKQDSRDKGFQEKLRSFFKMNKGPGNNNTYKSCSRQCNGNMDLYVKCPLPGTWLTSIGLIWFRRVKTQIRGLCCANRWSDYRA